VRGLALLAITTTLTLIPAPIVSALDQPATSPSPVLHETAADSSSFNWLDRVNAIRAAADLPPLEEDAEWSAGSALHSRYMVKNDHLGHDEDERNPWFTPEGEAAAENGLAYTNDRYDADVQRGIDAFLTTPFHLVSVLDPRLVKAGSGWYRERKGSYQAAVTMDVSRGLSAKAPATDFPILFPENGKTMPFSRYYGIERPNPLPGCPGKSVLGAPMIVQLASAPEDVSVTLTRAGEEVDLCVFDETTYVHPDPVEQEDGRAVLGARHAIVIMPRDPFTHDTYRVRLTSRGETFSWWFYGPSDSNRAAAAGTRTTQPGPGRF